MSHNTVDVQILLLLEPEKQVSSEEIKKYFSKYEKLQELFWGYDDTDLVFTRLDKSKELYKYLRSSIYDLIVIDEDALANAPQLLLAIKDIGIPILFIKSRKKKEFKIENIFNYEQAYWSDRRSLIRAVRKSVRNALKHALTFQVNRDRFVSKVLGMFINNSNFELDEFLPKALEEVAQFCSLDKVHVWSFNNENSTMSKNYQWSKPGVKFHFDLGEQVPMDALPWIVSKIKNEEIISFSNLSQVPQTAKSDKRIFKLANNLSFLAVPLVSNNYVFGYIGFCSVQKEREWGQRTISLQKTLSKIFIAALEIHSSKQALVRFEDYFSNITENLKEGLIITDSSGSIERINHSAKRMLNVNELDCVGKEIKEIISNEAWAEVLFSLKCKKEKKVHTQEAIEFSDSNKNCKWLKFNAASPNKELNFDLKNKIVILITDITNQRKIEDQLRHSQSMEALGRVVGGVAHDFNNLLTAVLGYSTLLLDRMPENSTYRSDIIQIKKAGEQASSLVNQLLTFSRKKVLSPTLIDLNSVVVESIKMLERLIPEDIKFEITLGKNIPKVKLDPVLLQQIIMNLVINARDAMPRGGQIIVRTKLSNEANKADQKIILNIEDTGTGIPDDILSNIFEPFFTTKAEGQGTGLGLSTVYGAVKQSGGEIFVDSKIEKGTKFLISFPKVCREGRCVEALRIPKPLAKSIVTQKFNSTSQTVLLVDDDSSIRHLVKKVLHIKGYKVLEAINGTEALRVCRNYPYEIDLLITDIVMPKVSGYEIVHEFVHSRPKSKILIISAYIKKGSLEKILKNGNCDLLAKPFTSKQLLSSLDEAAIDDDYGAGNEIVELTCKTDKITR